MSGGRGGAREVGAGVGSVEGGRVVVIGRGAEAGTLVPALVEAGACHGSMLQRSPSYVASVPSRDRVATRVRQVMPDAVAHRVVRAKNVALSTLGYQVLRLSLIHISEPTRTY